MIETADAKSGRGVVAESSPYLILIKKPQVMERLRDRRRPALEKLKCDIFDLLTEGFGNKGCQTIRLASADDRTGNKPPMTHLAVVNPIFTGDLHPDVQTALSTIDPNESVGDLSFTQRRNTLASLLPEITPTILKPIPTPFLRSIGRRMGKYFGPEPYFVNMAFRGDPDGLIASLPPNFTPHFGWMGMAKFGSTVHIDVPYRYQGNHATAEEARLYTLEGGNILVPLEELAEELVLRASTTDLPKSLTDESLTIPTYLWERSPIVRALARFGEFAGKKKLIHPPVLVDNYIHGGMLKKLVKSVAKMGQAAEGAFVGYDDGLLIPGFTNEPGTSVITRSGQFGTVKTNIQPQDLNAAKPTNWFGNVVSIGMSGKEFAGSSVEAIELVNTQLVLMAKDPVRFGIRKGFDWVPPMIFQLHLHNLIDRRYLPEKIFSIPWDANNHPVGSCGKDSMKRLVEYATAHGIDEWKKRGMTDRIAFTYIPNHGQIIFVFRTPNEDPIKVTRDALELLDRSKFIPTPMVRLALAKDTGNYPEISIA